MNNPTELHEAAARSVSRLENTIEQAIDMTKNLIRFTVRQEVETFNSRLVELEGRLKEVQQQNTQMRRDASQDALIYLQQHPHPPKN